MDSALPFIIRHNHTDTEKVINKLTGICSSENLGGAPLFVRVLEPIEVEKRNESRWPQTGQTALLFTFSYSELTAKHTQAKTLTSFTFQLYLLKGALINFY